MVIVEVSDTLAFDSKFEVLIRVKLSILNPIHFCLSLKVKVRWSASQNEVKQIIQ